MALTGSSFKTADAKLFDSDAQEWESDFTESYKLYAGQGFETPENEIWINKPTGTDIEGLVMAFPRSSESEGGGPITSGGWKVKEC